MLNVNSLAYSSYMNSGWSNVEFTSGNPIGLSGNVPLYAWVESNAVNTATNTLVWVNLGSSTIAANGGTLTIYMNFLLSNVMTSNTAYTGEAPQMYGGSYAQTSYAQYDNGAQVFNNYWNFVTTPSGWSLGTGWTASNGLSTAASTASTIYYATYSIASTPPITEDFFTNLPAGSSSSNQQFGFLNNPYTGGELGWSNSEVGTYSCGTSVWCVAAYMSSTGDFANTNYYLGSGVYTIDYVSTNSVYGQFNYGSLVDHVTADITSSAPVGGYQYYGSAFTIQWLRTRAYPPGGVMPTTSLGSTTSTGSAIYSLTMTPGSGGTVSPSSGNYLTGNTVTITATPNTGFAFTGWTGVGTGSYTGMSNPANIVMNSNIIETASFGQISYVPITLTNSQTSPTISGFQQMLTIPSSSYSSYINSGWTNVEFTSGNYVGAPGNVPLYAWVESNAVNTATNTIVWVNLGSSTIPANSGTLTIYMNILPSNVMTSNAAYTGEAPQLYGGSYAQTSYGQYDNGANVFSYYQRWGGLSSLPSGWGNNAYGSETYQSTYTSFASTTTSTNCWAMAYETAPSFFASSPFAYDAYATLYKGAGTNKQDCSGIGAPATGSACNPAQWSCAYYAVGGQDGNSNGNPDYFSISSSIFSGAIATPTSPAVYSMYVTSSGASGTLNYGTLYSLSFGAQSVPYIYLGLYTGAYTSADTANYYWTRGRVYPPNAIMPSASLGSFV
jgi:hypothetical protein